MAVRRWLAAHLQPIPAHQSEYYTVTFFLRSVLLFYSFSSLSLSLAFFISFHKLFYTCGSLRKCECKPPPCHSSFHQQPFIDIMIALFVSCATRAPAHLNRPPARRCITHPWLDGNTTYITHPPQPHIYLLNSLYYAATGNRCHWKLINLCSSKWWKVKFMCSVYFFHLRIADVDGEWMDKVSIK